MSDVDNKVKMIVEGLLLAAGRPLTLDNIIQVFSDEEKPDRQELKAVMDSIAKECDDRGFELIEVASGFRFQVKQDLSEWVAKLWEERPPRYTRALLETLALIAYRQPITRGDIEEIRGVAVSSNIIRTLIDREWVRVVGHRDVPGRPAMFATTKQFLDYFSLKSLQELPPLSEIKDLEKVDRETNLEEVLQDSRVLELPEDAIDESSFEYGLDESELLAEEEAIELSKKPLDEILNLETESEELAEDLEEEVSNKITSNTLSDFDGSEIDSGIDEDLDAATEVDGDESDADDSFTVVDESDEEDYEASDGLDIADVDSLDEDDTSDMEFSIEDDYDEIERD